VESENCYYDLATPLSEANYAWSTSVFLRGVGHKNLRLNYLRIVGSNDVREGEDLAKLKTNVAAFIECASNLWPTKGRMRNLRRHDSGLPHYACFSLAAAFMPRSENCLALFERLLDIEFRSPSWVAALFVGVIVARLPRARS